MSSQAPSPLPQPGWYPDPSGPPGHLRWWDGATWTAWVAAPFLPTALAPALGSFDPGHPAAAAEAPDGATPAPRIPARAAWWALLGLAIGELVGGVVGVVLALSTGVSTTSAVVTLAGELGLWSGMLGACVLVARRYGTGSLRHDLGLRFRWVDLAWGPVVTIAGLVTTALASRPFVGTRLAGSNTQLIGGQAHNTVGAAIIALIVSIGAPLFEELFFRGLVRTALAARLGPIGAVFAQAGLFGLAHLNPTSGLGNIEVVVVIGCFGVVLGLAAHVSGRLAPGMIGHGLYNLIVTITVLTR